MSSTVALFVPCYVNELWPQAGRAAVELIEAAGHRVSITDAVCCGQVLANSGEAADATRVYDVWDSAHQAAHEVVVLSASCTGHLLQQGAQVREFCEWFVAQAPREFATPVPRMVALHTSCSALRETKTAWAEQELLRRVPQLAVHTPKQADECCGFGGSFSTGFADLSVKMGQDKIANLEQSAQRIDAIVSADCSCLLHLRGVAREDLEFFHIAEILRMAIG